MGNMAVVVKRTNKNRYKTHRILLSNGAEFVFEKTKKAELATANLLTNSKQGMEIKPASNNIIFNSSEMSISKAKICIFHSSCNSVWRYSL